MNRIPGIDVSEAKTSSDALAIAKLNWEVATVPLFTASNGPVTSHKAIVRVNDGKPLGVVGKNYSLVQNADMFSVADVLARDEGVKFARAGSFEDGKKIYLSLQLPGEIRLGNDVTRKYLTLFNSHDGTSALSGLINAIRLFCTNQLPNLLHSGFLRTNSSDRVSIRHTGGMDEKLDVARQTLGQAMGFYRAYERVANRLYETRFSAGNMLALTKMLFPVGPGVAEIPTRTVNNRLTLLDLFENGAGHEETRIQGTAWAALNAVAEYVDHKRTTRVRRGNPNTVDEQRTASAWFGTGALMKRHAFDFITSTTGIDVKQVVLN